MKKLLCIILALSLLMGLSVTAFAADSDFTIENGVLIKYNGAGGNVVIPDGVTTIGAEPSGDTKVSDIAFCNCDELLSVVIPEGVTTINSFAFSDCRRLSTLTIPASLTTVEMNAFIFSDRIRTIYYGGSEEQWKELIETNYTAELQDAVVHFTDDDTVTVSKNGLSIVLNGVIGYEDIDDDYEDIYAPDRVYHLSSAVDVPVIVKNVSNESDIIEISNYYGEANKFPGNDEWSIGSSGPDWEVECPAGTSLKHEPTLPFDENVRLHVNKNVDYPSFFPLYDNLLWGEAYTSYIVDDGRISLSKRTVDGVSFDEHYAAFVSASEKFSDVAADAYYAKPVTWAMEKEITDGTSDSTFSPDETCSNAHILTFLWRAYGKPEADAAGLTDVAADDYFYGAANWAKSLGMISGTEMSPDAPCTRASTVMFMWKAAGCPTVDYWNSFSDVPDDADYAMAVTWAVYHGVTKGTSDTTFSPNDTCTRGQIMTFLYRALA